MAWHGGSTDGTGKVFAENLSPLLGVLKGGIARAGYVKLFILGLAIGVGIGVLGGRFAERLRLADYAAIEEIILDQERSLNQGRPGPPRLPSPTEPSRI